MIEELVLGFIGLIVLVYIVSGIRIIRPNRRAIIERFGKFKRIKASGITWVAPFIEQSYLINITEQMMEAGKQEVITKDRLNAMVDVQVYYKIGDTENDIKASQYNVNNYTVQIVALARTTLRNVIGQYEFSIVNNERSTLNTKIRESISKETENWGIDVVRCELKEIEAPRDVQDTMNKVLKAQNEKTAAIDFATAQETQADGIKRAAIKEAEGRKQAAILNAEGSASAITTVAKANAEQIKLVNEAAEKYFVGNAQKMKQYEVTQASLQDNAKVVITEKGISPVLVLGEGAFPLPPKKGAGLPKLTDTKKGMEVK